MDPTTPPYGPPLVQSGSLRRAACAAEGATTNIDATRQRAAITSRQVLIVVSARNLFRFAARGQRRKVSIRAAESTQEAVNDTLPSVDPRGFEPLTSWLPAKRSTS